MEDEAYTVPPAVLPEGDELTASEAATARAIFDSFVLPPSRVRELRLAPANVRVMESDKLRLALAEMGFVVGGAALFELVAQADPSAVGALTLPTWLDCVRHRKSVAAKAEREADIRDAYAALGGISGKADKVALKPLLDVMRRFRIEADIAQALEAVVLRRLAAVDEITALGGALDDDDWADVKDATRCDFHDLCAFAEAVSGGRAHGATPRRA
ncbi:hypothetical protein KFE25_006049 [Diacronema lutheri]|uniref:Uncharacterized protein n=1 Tax=Diacronema lutheri TaxID=2081491 RepID=A0A8J5Y1D1_DIALT|nr:hypothetical protein KFE25_006049 [Diacronema lutheri]